MVTKQLVMGVAVATLLCGCAENRSSFFIMGILAPDDECAAEPSEEGPYIPQGALDIAYASNYIIFPQLSNQLSGRGDEQNFISETNGIQVEGANIKIWRGGRPQGDTVYEFYQPAACYVFPQSISSCFFIPIPEVAVQQLVGLAFQGREIGEISPDELLAYDDIVTVGIQILGTTNGGTEVETPEFYFTVNLTYGASTLCRYPDEYGVYCASVDVLSLTQSIGCVGQGDAVDCCVRGEAFCAAMCAGF